MRAGESKQVVVHTILQLFDGEGRPVLPPQYLQEFAKEGPGMDRLLVRLVSRYERDYPSRTLRWNWVSAYGFTGEARLSKNVVHRFNVLITPVEPDVSGELSI